jgi:hypothetical protein
MSTRSLLIATTTAAVLASGGAAAAADAPVVSAQHTHTGTSPLTVPGTGVKAGAALPKGARLISRDVTLEAGQAARVVLRAPVGKTLRGVGMPEGQKVGFQLVGRTSYVGRRQVTLRATVVRQVRGEVTGRVYALAR